MTQFSLVDAVARRDFSLEGFGKGALELINRLRPADGWAVVFLLALNLMVVVWSVGKAEWVETPSLVSLILLAMVVGLALSRIPLWSVLVLPVGLAIGLLVVVWQLTGFQSLTVNVESSAELWQRLYAFYVAMRTGDINLDKVPFAFALMSLTWLSGYLAAWALFRWGNFWAVFILGGAGLMSNLTYLPDTASSDLLLYLFTALLLVARVQAARRRREWQRRGIEHDGHLGVLAFADSFVIAIGVLTVAYLLPVGGTADAPNAVYEYMRAPLRHLEGDFNRLFAGLPARRPIGFRAWEDVVAFQGSINPTTTPVLQVASPLPAYWRAHSYTTYTGKGWKSEETESVQVGAAPNAAGPGYRSRINLQYTVTPQYASDNIFFGGSPVSINREAHIEALPEPVYELDLTDPARLSNLPPRLALAAANAQAVIARSRSGAVSPAALAEALPPEFEVLSLGRQGNQVVSLTLREKFPAEPDILSVHSGDGDIQPGESYEINASVSTARASRLRAAGTDYPTWALHYYTQLPPTLPDRVRELATEITAQANNPYDKAKAIEAYLKTFPYTLDVEAPPYGADGVDHFLFTLRRGYSEYFASALAVMLRTQGIPARLATGYTVGDRVPDENVFIVNDSHSHGWTEVYFPGYGWIDFEPTPGASLPTFTGLLEAEDSPEFVGSGGGQVFGDDDDEEDLFFPQVPTSPAELTWTERFQAWAPWLGSGLGVLLVLAGFGWLLWRQFLAVSPNPQVAYRRLGLLGALASARPLAHETPHQFGERLAVVLPNQRNQVANVIDTYVRHMYGRKALNQEETARMTEAWQQLRGALLMRALRRRETTRHERV